MRRSPASGAQIGDARARWIADASGEIPGRKLRMGKRIKGSSEGPFLSVSLLLCILLQSSCDTGPGV